jgi:hypothetical protein
MLATPTKPVLSSPTCSSVLSTKQVYVGTHVSSYNGILITFLFPQSPETVKSGAAAAQAARMSNAVENGSKCVSSLIFTMSVEMTNIFLV